MLKSHDLDFNRNLTIQGPGAAVLTISSSNNGYNVHVPVGRSVTMSDLSFKDSNTAKSGAGFVFNQGTLKLMHVTISGNSSSSTGTGGGILNDRNASLTLIDSTVSNNSAQYGGGIYNANGTLTINRSTISGNKAIGDQNSTAGGILAYGMLTIVNSTVSDNMTSGTGGGITVYGSQAFITFCTVYNNKAQDGGGGLSIQNDGKHLSHVEMKNSIVVGNHAPTGADITGTLTSHGYNLLQDVSQASLLYGKATSADLKSVSPGIGPLKYNGGPTETNALVPGSPAIDKIPSTACLATVATDQRDINRPQGSACDIGAFEAVPSH